MKINILSKKTITTADLVAYLHQAVPDWHVFWLNNNHRPVIGLLPKVRWRLAVNPSSADLPFVLTTDERDGQQTVQALDFVDFQNHLIAYQQKHAAAQYDTKDSYHHGLMGYVSYDVAANALNTNIAMQKTPLAYFGHYDYYLTPHADGWQLNVLADSPNTAYIDRIVQLLHDFCAVPSPPPITLSATICHADYQRAFAQVIDYLTAGDAYQVNLTQRWHGTSQTPISRHLPALFLATQAPFAGFVGVDGFDVLSVSPELFFNFSRQGDDVLLTTKPIKGTRPRSLDPALDNAYKLDLANSEKDLAENVMIVDLLRNDLGRYAQFGAVRVPVRFAVESFSNVHHLVSTITATLGDVPILKVLFDSLPAGSITGSPKKRACEIIDELESHPRGAYCGTMGYLNFDNTGQWNVLIRTLQGFFDDGQYHVHLWAGGGITVLSDGDGEYQECLDKIGQIKAILAQ